MLAAKQPASCPHNRNAPIDGDGQVCHHALARNVVCAGIAFDRKEAVGMHFPGSGTSSFPSQARAWLSFLWSRLLFAGNAPEPQPVRLGAVVCLLILPGILLYGCLSFHLFEPD